MDFDFMFHIIVREIWHLSYNSRWLDVSILVISPQLVLTLKFMSKGLRVGLDVENVALPKELY